MLLRHIYILRKNIRSVFIPFTFAAYYMLRHLQHAANANQDPKRLSVGTSYWLRTVKQKNPSRALPSAYTEVQLSLTSPLNSEKDIKKFSKWMKKSRLKTRLIHNSWN